MMELPLFGDRSSLSVPIDRFLYHYTSWQTLLEIVYSKILKMQNILRMNDPRESKDWSLATYQVMPTLEGATRINSVKLDAEVRRYKAHLKLVSFTRDVPSEETNDPYLGAGFARPTMWAHYAGNHTGACIVFDKERLESRFVADSPSLFGSPAQVLHGPILYTAERFAEDASLKPIGATEVQTLGPRRAVHQHFERLKDKIWFQKHADWRIEAEYRFVYYDPLTPGPIFVDISDCVLGLVLGSDFRPSHLPIAQEFDEVFGTEGTVCQCLWRGPRFDLINVEVQAGRRVYAASQRPPIHSAMEVSFGFGNHRNDRQ